MATRSNDSPASELYEDDLPRKRSRNHTADPSPSRNIALGFAQGNRIRHLLSGGYFLSPDFHAVWQEKPDALTPSNWSTIGPGAARLMDTDSTPSSYLGLSVPNRSSAGMSFRFGFRACSDFY